MGFDGAGSMPQELLYQSGHHPKDWSDWSIEPSLSRPAQVEQAPAAR